MNEKKNEVENYNKTGLGELLKTIVQVSQKSLKEISIENCGVTDVEILAF